MQRNVRDLRGFAIGAIDGTVGTVNDCCFNDDDWTIRYLVVDTGRWLSGRKVLISTVAVGHAGWMARRLPVALTRAQVAHGPGSDGQDLKGHESLVTAKGCHLRSGNAIIGCQIEATDGEIGHVEDLLINDRTWAIRYLVVNASSWWSGHRVLVASERITNVSWTEGRVVVDVTRAGGQGPALAH